MVLKTGPKAKLDLPPILDFRLFFWTRLAFSSWFNQSTGRSSSVFKTMDQITN